MYIPAYPPAYVDNINNHEQSGHLYVEFEECIGQKKPNRTNVSFAKVRRYPIYLYTLFFSAIVFSICNFATVKVQCC